MVRLTGSNLRRVAAGAGLAAAAMLMGGAGTAWASEPQPWQFGFQPPATPITQRVDAFHHELLIIITLITIFVMGLLAYVIVRFRASVHPVPTRTSHNSMIEVLWTVIPVLILVTIAVPSFKLMYYMDEVPKSDMTIKVTAHQWYWSYEYPDQKVGFDSNLVAEKDLKPGQKRLLAVDNPLVVPAGTNIRVQVTGTDVIHSWFVPSFGVQEYAIIGRLNEAWMNVLKPGTYFGECNQICGVNHAFMPIEVQVLSKDDFQKWLGGAKKKFALDAPQAVPGPQLAAAAN
ncbi:MAG TPA: cytochrome c oxidase subunit II [Stellaceae bacterium]|jgi:cytochrome c oxidase subunit 2|nr:cytochrome c oxidase subunit II [Stellaceae bacterium]